MDITTIDIIKIILAPVIAGIVLFIIKIMFNKYDNNIEERFTFYDANSSKRSKAINEAFNIMKKEIDDKLDIVSKEISKLTLGLNMVQQDLNNNTKEVAEIKTSLSYFEKDTNKRFIHNINAIQDNREEIVRLQEKYNSCPAKNNLKINK